MVDLSKHSSATGIRGSFDDAGLTALEKGLEEFRAYETQVGYYGGLTYPDGTAVSAVAAFHEFGTATMPQRSFIRSTLEDKRREIAQVTQEALADVLNGGNPRSAASKIARTIAYYVYQKLLTAKLWAAPLAQSTVDRKGHSTPLLDEKRLRTDLMWRVLKGGAIVAQGRAQYVRV